MANDEAGKVDMSDTKIDEMLNTILAMDSRLYPRAYLEAVLSLKQERASRELAAQIAGVWKPIREVRDVLGMCHGAVTSSTTTLSTAIAGASAASEVFAEQLAKSTDLLARWTKWLMIATAVVAFGTLGSVWVLYWSEVQKGRDAERQVERAQEPPAPAAPAAKPR